MLVVHLEALGAVVRATSILPSIKRKCPQSQITWVTQAPAHHLLANNPYVDRILTTSASDLLALSALHFDFAFVVDKSLKAGGVLHRVTYDHLFGFQVDRETGVIMPASEAARELWELGLDDHRKFFVNKKPETQLMIEALELGPYRRDPYVIRLSDVETREVSFRRAAWAPQGEILVGINTGCSPTIPYKKLSIERQRELVANLIKVSGIRVVLLGGPEDDERNRLIGVGYPVIQSPTGAGLRDGLVSTAACDIVVSGDSLGMHMAIALGKWVVAWFGPTCAHEIDLYDRGVIVHTGVRCGPCWKRSCNRSEMCYDRVALNDLLSGVRKGIEWRTSSTRQPSSATCSYPFPLF
ncbi:MAG: glycosyltransferase family 9 protein [Bdellovibrionaceae bacterium]|nr:glycosyltransferase family 9 protein [Bdellovibrionales bacterium]MCB9085889.1 glycosyltransferase family 9 protein [Pseudobdellovibrionaceae bacterium]